MKFAFTTFACPKLDFIQVVEVAVKLGFDGIEFRCDALHDHRVEAWSVTSERKEFRRLLEKRAMNVCCLATSLRMIEPDVLEPLRERLELASDLDCPLLRVFGGPVPDGVDRRHYHSDLVDHLRIAAEAADEFEVTLALETHDGLSRGRDMADVVRKVNHPRVRVLYDPLHPFRKGETPSETFSALGDLIVHVHLHDGLNDDQRVIVRPVGGGDLPLSDICQRLKVAEYDGYMVGEWFYEEYGLTTLESLERYQADLATLGLLQVDEL
ncbi:MAG: sugar phosphate isomerase/epimerase [Phycisphaeraceae bacterium]|nr:sugar phosphate isomerase/epimerase [Phycisphaeraceae bacterium]